MEDKSAVDVKVNEATAAQNEANDASTPAVGLLAHVVKDKEKKKKKKKLTPKQRALEKLDKASEKLLENGEALNELLGSVSYWLKFKEKTLYKLLHKQCIASLDYEMFKMMVKKSKEKPSDSKSNKDDDDGNDEQEMAAFEINTLSTVDFKIGYDDFKQVAGDLDIPCTNVQLHAICKLLDRESTGKIDYRKFTPEFLDSHLKRNFIDGLKFIKKAEPTRHSSYTFNKEFNKHFASQYPMYIKIDVKLITFVNERDYPGHLKNQMILTHSTVYSLIELIKEKVDIASSKISIYRDVTKSKQSYLEETKTLEEYGLASAAGAYNDVLKSKDNLTLYYDFRILNNDDPILKSDYYFSDYKFLTKKN